MSIANPPTLIWLYRRATARWLAALGLLSLAVAGPGPARAQETVITNASVWSWRKGTNEVSNPTTLWRGVGFGDKLWPTGSAPFHYGESLTGGTLLSDMRSNYSCIFLRIPFVVTNVAEISQ